MDVYLLPVMPVPPGSEPPFELYCEPPAEPAEAGQSGAPTAPSLLGRLVIRFKQALAEGEEEERRQETGDSDVAGGDAGTRVGRFIKRRLAAAVAEQRLLWHLRHVTSARLHHPATVTSERAMAIASAEFRKDFAKHRRWCVIDAAIVVASTPLALVPGPNFLAYYFIFRSVGHFFSWQGASKGLRPALWTPVPSVPLVDLQQSLSLDEASKAKRIADVAEALGLERLPVFMRRVTSRTAA